MSRRESLYQSVAASGAVLIVFIIGVCHEVVGTRLFPWGPALFGGALGWHAVGLGCIALGLVLLGGTLRFVRCPVIWPALVAAVAGLAVTGFTAVAHREFHLFAFTIVLAAASTAFGHRAAGALVGPDMPVDRLVTDAEPVPMSDAPGNLLGTPELPGLGVERT